MIGYLLARGYRVQGKRVRESMRRVDPEGVIERSISLNIIQRRRYSVPSPMALWHMDGQHKLVRYNPLHIISLLSVLTFKGPSAPQRIALLSYCFGMVYMLDTVF